MMSAPCSTAHSASPAPVTLASIKVMAAPNKKIARGEFIVARCLEMFNSARATNIGRPVGQGRIVALKMLRRNTSSTLQVHDRALSRHRAAVRSDRCAIVPGASQLLRVVLATVVLSAGVLAARAADPIDFKIGYLR